MRLIQLTLGVQLASAVQASSWSSNCAQLANQTFDDGTSINFAAIVSANSNFTGTSVETSYNTPQTDLPALCRVSFTVRTSPNSSATAEVWLPVPAAWTGRFLAVGNGGFAGGINYPDIVWGVRKGFATMSTNTGHNSTQGDGSWMLHHPEAMTDFGHRALHLTTLSAKEIVRRYYGNEVQWAYYAGCSTGGRQGLAASQRYFHDYNGILAGSAIASQTNTSAWQDWAALLQFPNNRPSYIPAEMWPIIHSAVLAQCDHLDGVTDGIIMDPTKCHFDPNVLRCNTTNTSTCLTQPQIHNLKRLYAGWPAISHPGLSPGGESSFAYLMNGATPQFGPSFYRYAVLNDSNWDWSTMNASDVAFANSINPGGMNAYDPDLQSFEEAGGKLLQYHGFADPLIPSMTAVRFYETVEEFYRDLGRGEDVDDFYRLFMVPGMGHCNGGDGAWVLDAAGQSGVLPPEEDMRHSMLWSLVAWVENGTKVDEVVGTKYVNDTQSLGVAFQRPVCPWPKVARFVGGDVEKAESWTCA